MFSFSFHVFFLFNLDREIFISLAYVQRQEPRLELQSFNIFLNHVKKENIQIYIYHQLFKIQNHLKFLQIPINKSSCSNIILLKDMLSLMYITSSYDGLCNSWNFLLIEVDIIISPSCSYLKKQETVIYSKFNILFFCKL